MEWLFGKRVTPEEMLRKNQRALNKAIRDLDRERMHMEQQEKKIIADIKKMAKEGQMDAVKIMARDLVRTRRYEKKFMMMKANIQAVSLKIQTLRSQNAMAQAMKGVTKAMQNMNRQMNLPQIQRILTEFEKQSEMMDMKEEIMNDAIDDAMDDAEDEEESDAVVSQVLDELGLQLGDQLSNLPQANASLSVAGGKIPNSEFTFGGDSTDLENKLMKEAFNEDFCSEEKIVKKRVLVVADSHGRDLGLPLHYKIGHKYTVEVMSNPGGKFNYVVRDLKAITKDFTEDDHVIVIAGTNDYDDAGDSDIVMSFDLCSITAVARNTKVHLVSIPLRYDFVFLNSDIIRANSIFERRAARFGLNNFIDITGFHQDCFTLHGLHLNRLGKSELVKSIINSVTD